jgi:signal transduction histidine kinase
MTGPLVGGLTVLLGLCGGAYLLVALRARRYTETPASLPFVASMTTTGTFAIALGAVAAAGASGDYFSSLATALWLFLPVPWVVFAMTYAGWRQLVTPGRVGVVTAVVTLGSIVELIDLSAVESQALVVAVITFKFAVYIGSTGLALVGATIILRTVYNNPVVERRPAGLLVLGGLTPWVCLVFTWIFTLGFDPVAGMVEVTVGFGLGAIASAYAVENTDAMESTPAAGNLGRSAVISEIDEAVFVVDERERIVDLNDAATQRFAINADVAAGNRLETVLDVPLATVNSNEILELRTAEGHREFAASVSRIGEQDGEPIGHATLLRDVTQRRTRQQRLEVLNRVLRHNLRNDMNVVKGYAEMAGEHTDDERSGEYIEQIATTASTLADLGEKARDVEQLVTAPRVTDDRRQVSTVVEDVVGELTDEYPETTVGSAVDVDTRLQLNHGLVKQVLRRLAENAAEHNDAENPRVEIRVGESDDPVFPLALTVADNGPGIPDHEWSVVEAGDESPLEHGSGLGLWVVNWGVTRLGGQVDLAENEPRGSLVTVALPESIDDPGGEVENESHDISVTNVEETESTRSITGTSDP